LALGIGMRSSSPLKERDLLPLLAFLEYDISLFQDEASFSSAHHQCKEDIPCKMAAMWLFVLLHKLSRLEAAVQLVLTALFEETKYVFRETNQRMTAGYVIPRN